MVWLPKHGFYVKVRHRNAFSVCVCPLFVKVCAKCASLSSMSFLTTCYATNCLLRFPRDINSVPTEPLKVNLLFTRVLKS